MGAGYVCPACGYDNLAESPWEDGRRSDEICPSCGIYFGYDDAAGGDLQAREVVYGRWRRAWIDGGMTWFSASREAPPAWDPARQLSRLKTHRD